MENHHPMLLIAVPQMGDPNFSKAVVLILQHDEEGAIGLVLNRPSEINFRKFSETQEVPCHESLYEEMIFRGGPVQVERGWILHNDESIEEKQEVIPGVFVSTGNDTLEDLMKRGSRPFRLYLGYAGWGEGQLEKEMVEGAWITAKADSKYIFDGDPEKIWNRVLSDMGVDPNRLMVGTGLH